MFLTDDATLDRQMPTAFPLWPPTAGLLQTAQAFPTAPCLPAALLVPRCVPVPGFTFPAASATGG